MAKTHIEGAACELLFASRAILKGYDVYTPCVGTQQGHDYVMRKDGAWRTVQVKKTTRGHHKKCDNIQAALNGNRNTPLPEGSYDLLALVCLELDRIWLIPVSDVKPKLTISKSIPRLSEWDKYIF